MAAITVKRVEELCKEQDIYVTDLEKMLGIARGTIRKWESGPQPSGTNIIKLANYFRVSSDYLLGLSDSRYTAEARTNDTGLLAIERARSMMGDTQKNDMDKIVSIAFDDIFKKINNDDEN